MTVKGQLKKLLMYLHEMPSGNRLRFIKSLDDGLRCHYCRCILDFITTAQPDSATEDHIIPKSKGGTRADGTVIACQKCNMARSSMDYQQFLARFRRAA